MLFRSTGSAAAPLVQAGLLAGIDAWLAADDQDADAPATRLPGGR